MMFMFVWFTVDPFENNNIAAANPALVQFYKNQLDGFRQNMVPAVSTPNSNAGKPKKFGGIWTPGWCVP